jgi:hypothetical protein
MAQDLAREVGSNLKRVEGDYDDELKTPDVEIRYDDRPSTQQTIEAEQELFEENYRAAHARRWEGQERWKGRSNEEARLVNILTPGAVMRKLKAAGVNASEAPAVHWVYAPDDKTGLLIPTVKTISTARLWLHEDAVYMKGTSQTHAGRIGVSAWVWDEASKKGVPKCLTSLQYDCGPEWSLMWFDEMDVPTRERYRGWRTALLALITNDVLTEDEVLRAFGPVNDSIASELYLETLKGYRERKAGFKK